MRGAGSGGGRRVYLFADEFTNYQEAELGLTFARLLRRLGYDAGALAAALYGLLGVPEDVIKVDYTLTSFSTSGIRTAKAFDRMMKKAFGPRPGTTFNEKIEAFALECGFTAADIAKFRSIMLK